MCDSAITFIVTQLHGIFRCSSLDVAEQQAMLLREDEDPEVRIMTPAEFYGAYQPKEEVQGISLDLGGMLLQGSEVIFQIPSGLEVTVIPYQYLSLLTMLNTQTDSPVVSFPGNFITSVISQAEAREVRTWLNENREQCMLSEHRFAQVRGLIADILVTPKAKNEA